MNIRSRLLIAALTAAFAGVACTSSTADQSSLTSPAFGLGTDANPLTGTITGLAGMCPAVTFTIERRIIRTDVTTTFGSAGCLALKNGVRVEVAGAVQTDGSLKAARVGLIASETPVAPPNVPTGIVSVSGGVHAFAGTCPSITFTIEGRTVKTNAVTAFGDAGCAAVKNEVRADVSGTVQPDGSVLALKVLVTPITTVPPPPPPVPPTVSTISGAITALTGTCPQLIITVGERKASTAAGTVFDGKACGELAVGAYVEITGAPAATSTAMVATRVVARK